MTKSVGDAIAIAKPPVVKPAATFMYRGGSPLKSFPRYKAFTAKSKAKSGTKPLLTAPSLWSEGGSEFWLFMLQYKIVDSPEDNWRFSKLTCASTNACLTFRISEGSKLKCLKLKIAV